MRVVCMVPSWTETLLNAGINVVGRTRYCIHPARLITNIPVVGGTKDVNWDLVEDLKPDVVLLDKEENPLEMAEGCPFLFLATHVSSLESLQYELLHLSIFFENSYLRARSELCQKIIDAPVRQWRADNIPGFIEWVRPVRFCDYHKVVYLIWQKPWMAVSSQTFIGSILKRLGAEVCEVEPGQKYPVIDIDDFKNSLFLFSSEPYPFAKKILSLRTWAKQAEIEGAIVDGESYSWFGDRSLRYLENYFEI